MFTNKTSHPEVNPGFIIKTIPSSGNAPAR